MLLCCCIAVVVRFSFFFFCILWGSNTLRLLSLQDDVVGKALTMMRGCLWLLAGVCLLYSFCVSNLKVLYDQTYTHTCTHIIAIHPSIHSFVCPSVHLLCMFIYHSSNGYQCHAIYAYSYNSIDLLEILSCSYCIDLVYIVVVITVVFVFIIVIVVVLFKFIQFFMFDLNTFLFWPLIDFRLDKHFKNINVHTNTWIHVSYTYTNTYIHTYVDTYVWTCIEYAHYPASNIKGFGLLVCISILLIGKPFMNRTENEMELIFGFLLNLNSFRNMILNYELLLKILLKSKVM